MKLTHNEKNIVRLNEAQLRRMIAESVKKVLREGALASLPHLINKYDPEKADEYSDQDNLIAKLEPYYRRLERDNFVPERDGDPEDNSATLSAAKKMCAILNNYFGGDYIEIVRGGADVILDLSNYWSGEDYDLMDMTDEYFNYCLQAKNEAPSDVKNELGEIAQALAHGYLPGVADKVKSQEDEREKNGGLKILGKIDLSKIDPRADKKKRW